MTNFLINKNKGLSPNNRKPAHGCEGGDVEKQSKRKSEGEAKRKPPKALKQSNHVKSPNKQISLKTEAEK